MLAEPLDRSIESVGRHVHGVVDMDSTATAGQADLRPPEADARPISGHDPDRLAILPPLDDRKAEDVDIEPLCGREVDDLEHELVDAGDRDPAHPTATLPARGRLAAVIEGFDYVTRLETDRLVLRPPEPEDLDAFAAIFADPEVIRHLGGSVRTRGDVREGIDVMIRHWELYRVGQFTLVRKADERILGRVGFLVWDAAEWVNGLRGEVREPYETELGWAIGRENWGHGYAPEAGLAARDWVFAERDVARLISLINLENQASIRVAEKLGASPGRIVEGPPFTGPTCVYEHER
jgi:RimJ/RimL family protein N-acetyltransferase